MIRNFDGYVSPIFEGDIAHSTSRLISYCDADARRWYALGDSGHIYPPWHGKIDINAVAITTQKVANDMCTRPGFRLG